MKNHEYFAELISRRIDGDLTKEEQEELYTHLAECGECRRYAEDMLMLSDAFAESIVEPPDTLRASVMRSVKAQRSRRRRIIPGVAGVLAASIAVVLFVRWMPFGGSDASNESMTDQDVMMSVPEDVMKENDLQQSAPKEGGAAFDDAGETKSATGGYIGGEAEESDGMVETAGMEAAEDLKHDVEPMMGTVTNEPMLTSAPTSAAATAPASAEPPKKMANYDAASAVNVREHAESQSNTNNTADGTGDASVMAAYSLPDAANSQDQNGVQLRSMMMAVQPLDSGETANSLNVVSNRLVIDRANVTTLTCGTVQNSVSGASAMAVAQIFDYLTTLELEEVSDGFDSEQVEGGMNCVVEYEDGHSESILYSPNGYLYCDGVWYEFDGSGGEESPSPTPSDSAAAPLTEEVPSPTPSESTPTDE